MTQLDDHAATVADIRATTAAMAAELESMGLGIQMDPRAVQMAAVVRVLMDAGLLTDAQWEVTIAEVQRDMLAGALAQAPEAKKRMLADQARKQLIVPGRKQ